MKVCVYGTGAIGGVLAARLARAGAQVSVVARGATLAAIRDNGLTLDGQTTRVGASDDPAALGPQDVVITATKAFGLPEIAPRMGPLLRADTAIMYAVNGVPWWYFHGAGGPLEGRRIPRLDPGDVLWSKVGVERTISGLVSFGASVVKPGVVHHEGPNNKLFVGEHMSGDAARVRALAELLRRGGFEIDTTSSVRREIWTKLRRTLVSSAVTVLTSLTSGAAAGSQELRPLYRAAMTELGAAAHAYGFAMKNDIDATLDAQSVSRHKPSMLQDLEAGRLMEIDAMFAAPLDLAHAAGVATPTLDLLVTLVKARARAARLYSG